MAALTDGGVDLGHTLVCWKKAPKPPCWPRPPAPGRRTAACTAGPSEILLAPGAHLRYVNLQDWGHGVWHFAHQKAIVERDASLQWTIAALGSRLSKVNQHVALVGPGPAARSTA